MLLLCLKPPNNFPYHSEYKILNNCSPQCPMGPIPVLPLLPSPTSPIWLLVLHTTLLTPFQTRWSVCCPSNRSNPLSPPTWSSHLQFPLPRKLFLPEKTSWFALSFPLSSFSHMPSFQRYFPCILSKIASPTLSFLASPLCNAFHKQNIYFIHCLLFIFSLECNLHEASYFNLLCPLLSLRQLEQCLEHSNHSINICSKINSRHLFMFLLFCILFYLLYAYIISYSQEYNKSSRSASFHFTEGKTNAEFE